MDCKCLKLTVGAITHDRPRSGLKWGAPGAHVMDVLTPRPHAAPGVLPAVQTAARN